MKKMVLLQLAILVAFAVAAQGIDSVKSNSKYIFKTSTLNSGRVYTEAYTPSAIFLKSTPKPCNFCHIESDTTLLSSIADTLKKLLPLKVAEMADKNIDMVLAIQPNFNGAVVDAHCGWVYSKELNLFSESELRLIRSYLLKLSFKVVSIDKNNNSQLCQPLTILLSKKYWER